MELREIVADVEGERSTLALCNVDAPGDMIDAVGGYLGPRHVAVRHTSTAEGVPENVAILHDGERSALLALETAERNTYRGFWTYRAEVVDRILDRLQEAYLPGPQE